ncbi:nuclear pore complex protein DDB_G0274915-like isoform X2 [Diachasmimorpha longicaudata]
MKRYRRNTYQLSSESLVNSPRTAGEFKSLKGLSPIPKRSFDAHISESENNVYGRSLVDQERIRAFDKVTSTPVIPWKLRDGKNGDVCGHSGVGQQHVKKSVSDVTCGGSREGEGSPWGTSISPKIRSRAAGVKTVQTVAGPLLASTRYNIDTKTYTDVTSPGLTSRLTKYATEASTKLLQSPYATGQFPRVNLNSSPTPLINSKTGKMRMPVTVRIAPPDSRFSPPERQRAISDICHDSPRTPPTVVQVLRDMSLKRHASRDDVTAELIKKKQRTDGLYNDELENLEEMTQKRARDDSSRSDEDLSIDSSSLRPLKRTKKPSCYDILNSLSSSTNVNSGVKRKADISRSGTPDIGKHFKSLDTSHLGSSGSSKSPGDIQNLKKSGSDSTLSLPEIVSRRNSESVSPRSPVRPPTNEIPPEIHEIEEIFKEAKNSMIDIPVKLTDRLFMREEPQNIDKLKNLIDEHSTFSSKFSKSDTEEIKKSDIINMRQTSMKAKLKSMFDAISGKTANTIDPSVVIQAESITSSPSSLATLSSSTSTTNVNTSPISTSAIVPIIGKAKTMGTPGKHVSFNLPSSQPSTSSSSGVVVPQVKLDKSEATQEIKKPESSTPGLAFGAKVITSSPSSSGDQPRGFIIPQISTAASSVSSSTSTANIMTPAATSSAQNLAFSFGTSSTSSTASTSAPAAQTVLTFSQSSQKLFQPTTGATTTVTTPRSDVTTKATTLFTPSTSTISLSGSSASLASGNGVLTFTGASKSPPKAAGLSFTGVSSTSAGVNQTTTTSTSSSGSAGFIFGGGLGTATTSTSSTFEATTTSAPGTSTQSSSFTFGGNKTTQSTTPSTGFSFGLTTTPAVTFGATTTSQAPVTTALTFGIGTSASTPSFGSSTTASSSFGTPSATSSTSSFGTTSTSSVFGNSTTAFGTSSTATPVFGNPVTTASIAFGTTSSSFGAPATTAPTFGAPATTASTFGAPATTASTFGAPSTTTSTFGAPATTTSTFGAPATTTSTFGAPSTTASTFGAPSTTSTFVNPSNTTFSSASTLFTNQPPSFNPITTAASVISFGTPKTTAQTFGTTTTTPTASLFNGVSTSSASNSMFSGGSAFGQGKALNFGFTTTTTATGFGATTTTSFSGGSSLFGGQPTTTTGFGVNSSSTSTTPAFGQTSSGFGGTTSAPPAFGTSSALSFGGTSPAFGAQSSGGSSSFSGSSVFGATTTAPPAFPTGTSSTGGIGGATTSFGTPTTAPLAFGSSSSSFSGFGGSNAGAGATSSFGGATSAFGTTGPGTSGTSSSFGGTTATGGFAFGTSATPATTQGTSGMFSFGGNNASSGFQFNGSTTVQTGGFNFSGTAAPASSTVPSFSAPAAQFGAASGGNMFSIGSGSVGARSRSGRQARRQR